MLLGMKISDVAMVISKRMQVRKKPDDNINGNLKAKIVTFRCLRPGSPNPTFRFDHVVNN